MCLLFHLFLSAVLVSDPSRVSSVVKTEDELNIAASMETAEIKSCTARDIKDRVLENLRGTGKGRMWPRLCVRFYHFYPNSFVWLRVGEDDPSFLTNKTEAHSSDPLGRADNTRPTQWKMLDTVSQEHSHRFLVGLNKLKGNIYFKHCLRCF